MSRFAYEWTPRRIKAALALLNDGWTYRQIANELGCGKRSLEAMLERPMPKDKAA